MIEFEWPQIRQLRDGAQLEIKLRAVGSEEGWHTIRRYFDTEEQARAFVEGANWYAEAMAAAAFPKMSPKLIDPPK